MTTENAEELHPDERVLLVEEDADLREAMAGWLEESGYNVSTAGNGAEALNLLRAGLVPCVILLDLMMPKVNGWQFRDEQKKHAAWAEIPVVVVSAMANLKERPIDAAAVVQKPVNLKVLTGLLDKHC